jgi:hypothetical protein
MAMATAAASKTARARCLGLGHGTPGSLLACLLHSSFLSCPVCLCERAATISMEKKRIRCSLLSLSILTSTVGFSLLLETLKAVLLVSCRRRWMINGFLHRSRRRAPPSKPSMLALPPPVVCFLSSLSCWWRREEPNNSASERGKERKKIRAALTS